MRYWKRKQYLHDAMYRVEIPYYKPRLMIRISDPTIQPQPINTTKQVKLEQLRLEDVVLPVVARNQPTTTSQPRTHRWGDKTHGNSLTSEHSPPFSRSIAYDWKRPSDVMTITCGDVLSTPPKLHQKKEYPSRSVTRLTDSSLRHCARPRPREA